MDSVLPSDATGPTPGTASDAPHHLDAVLATLGAGDPQAVGRFRVDLRTDVWWWSDEVYAMHGFAPGEVVPTTPLVLAHKHPDDRARVARTLARVARAGESFGSMHRIVDATGRARTLAVAARGRRSRTSGQVVEITGYFLDLTASHEAAARREATTAIRAADASRSDIEQAKGVLMVAFGMSPEDAFELLRRRSNNSNVPVRELARHLVDGLRAHGEVLEAARERVEQILADAESDARPEQETPADG